MENNTNVEITPLKTVYGIGDNFFDTLDELRAFCGSNGRPMTGWFQLSYIGDYEGKKDVIRMWKETYSKLFAVGNITDEQRQEKEQEWESELNEYTCYESYDERTESWKVCQGTLITWYRAFRTRGVKFNNDIYANVEEYLDNVHGRQSETGGRQLTLTKPNTQQ